MWSLLVVVPDPALNYDLGLAQRLEGMEPDALFLQGTEESLDEAVLLRGLRRRELLGKAIGLYRAGVVATAENEPVIGAKGQRMLNAPQRPEPIDQRFLQRRLRGLAAAIAR